MRYYEFIFRDKETDAIVTRVTIKDEGQKPEEIDLKVWQSIKDIHKENWTKLYLDDVIRHDTDAQGEYWIDDYIHLVSDLK